MIRIHTIVNTFKYITLLIGVFVVLFPPYVVIVNSFKADEEFNTGSTMALPESFFNFDNFRAVFERGGLINGFTNTLIIICVSLAFNILFGTMVAYVLGRFEFRMKKAVFALYLFATVIPGITTQVATFGIIKSLGLYNTIGAPIILYIGADVIQIILYLQFIRNIPVDLDENAMVEGASLFRIYRSILFPLLTPATSTLIILKSISIYNDMYTPYLYMPKQTLGVVTTVLMRFQSLNVANWNLISAAILLILLPTVILYFFLQKYIFEGVTSGAVK
ncbi:MULTISPECIES: carbohydrate ABC transporter permease [Paenibacillus]|jgi:multiple sugar transport system permease protein|uniref:carbohydrate ABC transporter permease n=1 Tax=Paenibacillus TaxID=44249 RepID=UPI0001AFD1CC|nr:MULTISPECIES: carbohydrate ABC transporter permease [Paenibacillus]EES74105.1 ABC transporter, permease protein [Paenibacillus sp. oral taxon 786 str. D14]